jgi:NitT/TauT family transport system ATP-binding protein
MRTEPRMNKILLECDNVSHWFGANKVLFQVNLKILRGQIVSLVGPSGSGKSTLLRAILGTHPPRSGRVLIDGRVVYQRYSLFPFLTAVKNVALGLMLDQTSPGLRLFRPWKWRELRRAHLRQATELLEQVGLGAALDLYPDEMSGGMCQRVAIAQALIMRPKILLLDEPFGALDEAMREELQLMLLRLYEANLEASAQGRIPPHTILIVTHEINEAIYVASRVVGLSQYHRQGDQGATIVYDKAAPIFSPLDQRNHLTFAAQKDEVLQAVFDSKSARDHEEYITFWHELAVRETSELSNR